MPTVLVPLDETAVAESILPDAQQLAGPGGRLVLVYGAAHGERAGDVAADLIERLSLPIVVIPALAELAQQPEEGMSVEITAASAGLPAVR